jgi:hypothetical protein
MDSAESKASSASAISGKLVIVGIVTVALWAAATSWYFRYNATHHAVKFWGPEAATMIRDAPIVKINRGGNLDGSPAAALKADVAATNIDVSHAHGLTHLRNALLEDHNFDWTTVDKVPEHIGLVYWWLLFEDPKTGKLTTVWLSDDFRIASRPDGSKVHSVSLDPVMTKGLQEMLAEFTGTASTSPAGEAETTTKPAGAAR